LGQLLEIATDMGEDGLLSVKVEGADEAIRDYAQTLNTSLGILGSTPTNAQHPKSLAIAHLTVVIAALLDELGSGHNGRELLVAEFREAALGAFEYMRGQLTGALQTLEPDVAMQEVGGKYGKAYFALHWWRHMPQGEDRPGPY